MQVKADKKYYRNFSSSYNQIDGAFHAPFIRSYEITSDNLYNGNKVSINKAENNKNVLQKKEITQNLNSQPWDKKRGKESKREDSKLGKESKREDLKLRKQSRREDSEAGKGYEREDSELRKRSRREDSELRKQSRREDSESRKQSRGEDSESGKQSKREDSQLRKRSRGEDSELRKQSRRGNLRVGKRDKREISEAGKQSPETKSRCPYSKRCGGCQMIDVPYETQLKNKQKNLEKLLSPYGKPEPIIGMENPDFYRNKVHAVFGLDEKKRVVAGVYEEKSHRVVNVESCYLENQKATAIIRTIKNMLKSFKIKTYDEDTKYGLLRHVLVRTAHNTGQIMVVLVLASPILPSKNNFVKALLKEHPEITTIVVNLNDRSTSMVLGDKEQVIFGKGYIEDTLCQKNFKISPKSFYQVNPIQTEKLYGMALEFAELTGEETILDAYCGIGTIGIIASDRAKRVIGVELNPDAVRDAVVNAKINGVRNIEIYNKDAGQFMIQLAQQKEKLDVVFMDPPRTGSDEAFLKSLITCAPKKIVYISCSPETLARDLKYLTARGYEVKRMRGCDMFCYTGHVECVVLMSKVQN